MRFVVVSGLGDRDMYVSCPRLRYPRNQKASSACFRALQDRRLCTGLVPDSKARSSYCWCSHQGSLVDVFLNVFILPRTSTYSYVVLGLVATHFAYQYAFCVCVCVL